MRNAKTVVVVLALCAAGAGGGVAVAAAKPRPARPPAGCGRRLAQKRLKELGEGRERMEPWW